MFDTIQHKHVAFFNVLLQDALYIIQIFDMCEGVGLRKRRDCVRKNLMGPFVGRLAGGLTRRLIGDLTGAIVWGLVRELEGSSGLW